MTNTSDGNSQEELINILRNDLRSLQKDKIKLTSILENCPANILITDLDGKIQYTNSDFFRLTGYGPDEVMGKNPRILSSGTHSPEFYQNLWDTITAGNVWQGEFYNRKKNGEYYWEKAYIAPLKDDEGITTNYVAIKFDITTQKYTDFELRGTIKSRDKMLSILSHDLKSPFGSIVGLTDIVLENLHTYPPEEIRKIFGLLNSSSRQALELIDNLLVWARSQSGKIKAEPSDIYLAGLVAEVIASSKSQAITKDIHLCHSVDKQIMVFTDPNWARTVLRNLVTNAIKFTHRHGNVTISAKTDLNFVTISVEDTGIGISEDDIKNLFQIDQKVTNIGTENERGTGLGLLLCKEFIEKLGGEIWVESELDKGSKFIFTLPCK